MWVNYCFIRDNTASACHPTTRFFSKSYWREELEFSESSFRLSTLTAENKHCIISFTFLLSKKYVVASRVGGSKYMKPKTIYQRFEDKLNLAVNGLFAKEEG